MLKSPERRLYLEDVHVGQRFTSRPHLIDAEQIMRFALDYDPQPFHLSEEAAAESIFGSLAASGWHTMAISMRLLVESLPIAGGVIGAGAEVSWPKPTRPGMALQVFSEFIEIKPSRSKPDRAIVTMRSETRDQHGEAVQAAVAKLVVLRRPIRSDARERLLDAAP